MLTAGNLMQTDQLLAGVVMLSVLGLLIAWGLGMRRALGAAMALRHPASSQQEVREEPCCVEPSLPARRRPAGRPAFGQAYPSKPITIVVPFAAGGPTDLMARIVGERMGKELGQQFIIDNTTGAAGTIAIGKLARAAPDGYTISIGHVGTHVANGTIYKNLTYDLLTDLEPIARLPANPMLVVTSNQVPAKDLKELVDYLKANPTRSRAAPRAWARARTSARWPSSPRPAPSTSSCPIAAPAPPCRT